MRGRWLLGSLAALMFAGACSAGSSGGSTATEERFLLEMHAAGNYHDQDSREMAQNMCLADSVDKAEAALYMSATQYPDLAKLVGIAAGLGVQVYCPEKADYWLEASERLSSKL